MFTEEEAWRAIADLLALPREERKFVGICEAISEIGEAGLVNYNMRRRMYYKTDKEVVRARGFCAEWLAPRTPAGDLVRMEFCHRMADELQTKDGE